MSAAFSEVQPVLRRSARKTTTENETLSSTHVEADSQSSTEWFRRYNSITLSGLRRERHGERPSRREELQVGVREVHPYRDRSGDRVSGYRRVDGKSLIVGFQCT